MIPVAFFFSSRRRHTRSLRDWSSDVCSSDLASARNMNLASADREACSSAPGLSRRKLSRTVAAGSSTRSEERRVGKECRSRRAQHRSKKKADGQAASPWGDEIEAEAAGLACE